MKQNVGVAMRFASRTPIRDNQLFQDDGGTSVGRQKGKRNDYLADTETKFISNVRLHVCEQRVFVKRGNAVRERRSRYLYKTEFFLSFR